MRANLVKARAAQTPEMRKAQGLKNRKPGGGVCCANSGEKWKAYIYVDGKQVYLGTFETKEAAIAARKAAELKYWI